MIQRIQSFWLLIVAGLFIAYFFVPFAAVQTATEVKTLTFAGTLCSLTDFGFSGLIARIIGLFSLILAVKTLIALFSYKNRKKQLKQVNFNVALSALQLLLMLVLYFMLNDGNELYISWFNLFPVIGIALTLLAGFFIRKDKELVRSIDRIR